MSDSIVPAIIEGARILGNVQNERARYDYLTTTSALRSNRATTPASYEETAPDVELNNYTTRKQIDAGTHVLVTEHKEYLEKVKPPYVPPTPEELAEERAHKRYLHKVWGSVAIVGIAITGIVVIAERHTKTVVDAVI